ncbi:transcriptional regulator [Kouleothrix aurantiaca]|jgi:two-component system KDP operon response regulator KdpE|uniref:Transcriptional regulator n=1 Tax=Kouleothrix aurantiaca TaxID=186479 RepID=A0A0P9F8K1_9CHLR|nr:transcriptional regulator [Kouleothrix aurantiaca]
MRQSFTVLVVDDEQAVRMMLEAALRAQGYKIQSAASGSAAREILANDEFDLVLLDLQLGDSDGIEILRELKRDKPATEVILLTAHGSINSAISALRYGAFDYLLKPAQVSDIRERVERALTQRHTNQQRNELLQRISDSARALGMIDGSESDPPPARQNSDRIEVGPLLLDLRRHAANLGNHTLTLTRTEFALLTALAQQPDTALSYSILSEAVYGRAQPEDEARALLRPHIARLRHKLESTNVQGVALVSIRSMGYMLQTD